MSTFAFKILAITAMTCDHLGEFFFPMGDAFFPYNVILRAVGRFTMPIMCFFIAEGFRKTGDPGKYLFRLLVFAAISQVPYFLLFGSGANVMFTFAAGLTGLWASDYLKKLFNADSFRIPVYLATLIFVLVVDSDWSYVGLLLIYAFYHSHESLPKKIILPLCVYGLFFAVEAFTDMSGIGYISRGTFIQAVGCLSVPLLLVYNGKKGMGLKYLFYVYYPLHMILIWLLLTFVVKA